MLAFPPQEPLLMIRRLQNIVTFVSLLSTTAAGKLQQPAQVSSLPVFPKGLQSGRYHAKECQPAGSTKLQWARNRGDSAEYEVSLYSSAAALSESAITSWNTCCCKLSGARRAK